MADELLEEKFKTWLMPSAALKRVNTIFQSEDVSIRAIILRLEGGQIKSASHGYSYEYDDRTNKYSAITLISSDHWKAFHRLIRSADFWKTGDIRFAFGPSQKAYIPGLSGVLRAASYFNVRLDPQGLNALLASAFGEPGLMPRPDDDVKAPIATLPTEALERGPRVSDEWLSGWLELFRKTYGNTDQDTLATAWASAKGMFPDKSVARDRVHALLSGRKTGKKPGKPEK
jgi:hypothetical protein